MIPLNMWRTTALLLGVLDLTTAQRLECPLGLDGLASQMLESNVARGQGLEISNGSTGFIEIGLFQQAVYDSIASTDDTAEKQQWQTVLESSIVSANNTLANATRNTELPLDRLSIGTALVRWFNETKNASYIPTIKALQYSVTIQKRNDNGGLWYYDNPLNQSAYRNLSYLDGMFSYAPFAILSREFDYASDTANLNEAAAWTQLSILRRITERADGLFVHGYDPTNNHTWAQGANGVSPAVWARALAWYTLGVVNSIELLETQSSDLIYNFKCLYRDLVTAQLAASDRSLAIDGSYGVWQIVDHPGAIFDGKRNFIEASSSLMTAYAFLRGARLGWFDDEEQLKLRAQITGLGMFLGVKQRYLIENANGTLSLNGTSSVSSLSGNVDFEYYVTRPTVLNSLIGTSAFILAAREAEKLCLPTI